MSHPVYQKSLVIHLLRWQKRRARAIAPAWFEADLFLVRLDLDPLREHNEIFHLSFAIDFGNRRSLFAFARGLK